MERRFIVNSEGEAKEQKLNEGEPTRKFVADEHGEITIGAFTEEDREIFRLAESLDYKNFFKENPDLRGEFIEWYRKNKKEVSE